MFTLFMLFPNSLKFSSFLKNYIMKIKNFKNIYCKTIKKIVRIYNIIKCLNFELEKKDFFISLDQFLNFFLLQLCISNSLSNSFFLFETFCHLSNFI